MTAVNHERNMLQRWKDHWHAKLGAKVSFPLPLGHTHMIKAVFEPTNLTVYEKLLPAGLTMPSKPRVQVEFLHATPGWREASFNIACRHGDNEGWLGLYWPIDSYLGYKLGRLVGYPKHLAHSMSYTSDEKGVQAQVVHRGRTELRMEVTRQGIAFEREPEHERERKLAAEIVGPEGEQPHYLQVPPSRGPSINRLVFEEVRPLQTRAELCSVQLTFDLDAPFTALLPKDGRIAAAKIIERRGRGFGWLKARRMPTITALQLKPQLTEALQPRR